MTRPLGRAAARLFTVQGSWNYERLLGVGVGYATEPLLRDLPGGPNGERYRAALGRAVTTFNAHPYLAGLAVGAVARAEHDGDTPDDVARLRSALRGTLGAVGDRLVWAGSLPVASAAGLTLTAAGLGWAGPLAFLLIYNVVHLWLRAWGLRAGWQCGRNLAPALRSDTLMLLLRGMGPAALLLLGMALPLTAAWFLDRLDLAGGVAVAVVFLTVFGVGRWLAPTWRGPLLGLAVAVAVIVGGWL